MERQNASVGTEQGIATQHFNIPILEVEGIVGGYCCGIEGDLFVKDIRDGEI